MGPETVAVKPAGYCRLAAAFVHTGLLQRGVLPTWTYGLLESCRSSSSPTHPVAQCRESLIFEIVHISAHPVRGGWSSECREELRAHVCQTAPLHTTARVWPLTPHAPARPSPLLARGVRRCALTGGDLVPVAGTAWHRRVPVDTARKANQVRTIRRTGPQRGAGTPRGLQPTLPRTALWGSCAGTAWFYSVGSAKGGAPTCLCPSPCPSQSRPCNRLSTTAPSSTVSRPWGSMPSRDHTASCWRDATCPFKSFSLQGLQSGLQMAL